MLNEAGHGLRTGGTQEAATVDLMEANYKFMTNDQLIRELQSVSQRLADSNQRLAETEKRLQASRKQYLEIIDDSRVCIWDDNWSAAKMELDALTDQGVTNFREYFDDHPDEIKRLYCLCKPNAISGGLLRLYGAPSMEALCKDWNNRPSEAELNGFLSAMMSFMAGKSNFQYEATERKYDGSLIVTFSQITVLRNSVPDWSRVIYATSDVTERNRDIAEIKRLKDELQEENIYLREEVRLAHRFDEIIGDNSQLRRSLEAVEKVAPTDVTVLILGETGTGKELIARAIHNLSARRDKPLVSVSCPSLPTNLIESELFGHEKGAFTGAQSLRKGRFELADGGTIFLDELGELPIELQAKLLRVLQDGLFERLGGTETLHSDVRLIAATNRDLKQAVDKGEFRADLYYRVSPFPISLPPLRDRKDDIPLLVEHFVRKHARRLGKEVDAISSKALKELAGHSWPGNIRELEGIIERSLIALRDHSVLKLSGSLGSTLKKPDAEAYPSISTGDDLFTVERSHILDVLERADWKIAGTEGAASILGLPPSTLRSKMIRLGISRPTT